VLAWLVARRGLTDVQIAEMCGVTPNTVRRWRRDDGILQPRKEPVTREELCDLYWTQELSMAAIGAKLHRSRDSVRLLMRRLGVPVRRRGPVPGHRRRAGP
jgi:hypothetical protein